MLYKIYAVKDIVAEETGPIFQMKNDSVALRNYNQMLQDKNVDINDYELYRIAEYDTETMILTSIKPKRVNANVNMTTGETNE